MRRTVGLADFMSPEHGPAWRARHAADLPLGLWAALRDMRSSLSEVFERHFNDNEALKFALCANLPYYADDPDRFWWMGFAMAQGGYLQGGGYYIKGGSQRLTDALIEVIRKEGGIALANAPAVGVDLDQDGAVSGVRYQSGDARAEIAATTRTLIGNAAPHALEGLLPEAARPAFMAPFENRPLSISLVSATLGLDRPPADFGVSSYSTVLIPDWMERFSDFKMGAALLKAGPTGRLPPLCVVDYSQIDSGLSEDGLYPLNIVCADRLENWSDLSDADYRARRDAWLAAFIDRLDAEWPGLAGAVKASTIATARTLHHHLNTPGGAVYGFAMTPPESLPKQPPRVVKSAVEGLWISSAYTGFGGFTGAIGAGIAAAKAVMQNHPEGVAQP